MSNDRHVIKGGRLSAAISASGAELVSFRDGDAELLWQAGPEWPRHAPVLFPIVGRLAGDALRSGGEIYRVTQHGFARDRRFDWIDRSDSRAALALADDAETRALYPFAFRLEMIFEIADDALSVVSRVTNPSDEALPFSIGAHPGFRWPLADGIAKEDHVLEFSALETGNRRTVAGGLLADEAPLPFDGRTLKLSPELFANDALVMPNAASRSVRFVAKRADGSEARALTVSWRGYEDLGVWSAPKGAPFLCIEPWRGMASDVGWDGEFSEKPGVVTLGAGETMEFEWRVGVTG